MIMCHNFSFGIKAFRTKKASSLGEVHAFVMFETKNRKAILPRTACSVIDHGSKLFM